MAADIVFSNDIEDLLTALEYSQEIADSQVQDWQREQLVPGTYFCRVSSGIAIYGEILDPLENLSDNPEERAYEENLWKESHMQNYRFTKCFSKLCPKGELGDIHISTVKFLVTSEAFEKARENNWPMPNIGGLE